MEKTLKGEARLVQAGTILVMASATVGRAIVATKAHENTVISHHFMRVVPLAKKLAGWIYAYLRSPQAKAMMTSSQYASVIRHIEPHHLHGLPIPVVSDFLAEQFLDKVTEIVRLRNSATELTRKAEDAFSAAVGLLPTRSSRNGFPINLRQIQTGRRRFEGAYYTPETRAILSRFERSEPLEKLTKGVWWGETLSTKLWARRHAVSKCR